MITYPVWLNHARKSSETQSLHPDDFVTGWEFHSERPKEGFCDDIYASDFRGHSLDAPERLAAGSMESRSRRFPCPLQTYTRRGAHE